MTKRDVIACVLAFFISSIGYYVAEEIMFGFTADFFASLGGNLVQSDGSAIVFLITGAGVYSA